MARQTVAWTPDAKLHLLPNRGHLPWLDETEEMSALTRKFLHGEKRPSAEQASAAIFN